MKNIENNEILTYYEVQIHCIPQILNFKKNEAHRIFDLKIDPNLESI